MKCLSVKQPFADWILQGIKPRELRSYPIKHRGRLLIHSSKVPAVEFMKLYGIDSSKFRNGMILGVAHVTTAIQYSPGDWAWIMEPLKIFEHGIKYSGKLGLFDVNVEDLEIDRNSEDWKFLNHGKNREEIPGEIPPA